jgi:hypothetical protein
MANETKVSSRSLLRLLFWEGLAVAALLHLRQHPLADSFWSLNFFYNALFFLVAYPLLYVYRWKMAGGCLGAILWPLSFPLSWGLGASAYLWVAYAFLAAGSPYYNMMIHHPVVLGALFVFVYFPLLQPLCGLSKKYQSLGALFWIFLFSGLGGFLGYLLGQFVDRKYGASFAGGNRFLLWLALILIGTAVGALAARRRNGGGE